MPAGRVVVEAGIDMEDPFLHPTTGSCLGVKKRLMLELGMSYADSLRSF